MQTKEGKLIIKKIVLILLIKNLLILQNNLKKKTNVLINKIREEIEMVIDPKPDLINILISF